MEILIQEIVRKLHLLPETKIVEVLDFVDLLAGNKEHLALQQLENNFLREDEEFELIADRLADKLQGYVGDTVPILSDYAVSRSGIYEEHL